MSSGEVTKRHTQEGDGQPQPAEQAKDQSELKSASLSTKEVRFLKRQARKRKWVRRLQTCNNYVQALCKSTPFPRLISPLVPSLDGPVSSRDLQNKLFPP